MNTLFDPENPIGRFLTLVFDLAVLSVLFIVCSLPVVTFGASAAALYSVMLRRVRDEEGAIIAGFFRAFKENFKQGTAAGLIFIAVNLLLWLSYRSVGVLGNGTLMAIVTGCIIMMFLAAAGVFAYVFPLIARYENSLKVTFNNAWRLAVVNLPKTVLMVVLNNLPAIVLLFFTYIFMQFMFFWFFVLSGTAAYINAKLLRNIFDKLLPEKPAEEPSGEQDV